MVDTEREKRMRERATYKQDRKKKVNKKIERVFFLQSHFPNLTLIIALKRYTLSLNFYLRKKLFFVELFLPHNWKFKIYSPNLNKTDND